MPRGTERICPSEALTPAGRPAFRSFRLSSGPDSRQCWPDATVVPWARAAAAQAALPGAPNIQYWEPTRELNGLASWGCLEASRTAA